MMKQYVWNKFPKKYLPHQNINVWNILYGPLIYPLQSWWLACFPRSKAEPRRGELQKSWETWEKHGKTMGKSWKIIEEMENMGKSWKCLFRNIMSHW